MANCEGKKVEVAEQSALPPLTDEEKCTTVDTKLKVNPTKVEEEDSGITMLDVLEEEDELEENAYAVLGGSDDQNCTYSKGILKRQALYACRTCVPETTADSDLAGICLACSYNCHEGHDLVELYTKREFRCDCGNSKFPKQQKCTLQPDKSPVNDCNQYNHNFRGLYCTCNRPYPDPEDDTPDEMIQCILCEDWFHGRHLEADIPPEQEYAEMVCQQCMNAHQFLRAYVGLEKPELVEVEKEPTCKVANWSKPEVDHKGASFWPSDWRNRLCTCEKCLAVYSAEKVSFLTDKEDTVQAYEEHGKEARKARGTQYERGMKALSSLGHVQQIEALHEYNTLTSELKDYLKKFAENKKVVREEDIREFFGQMEARKRQRGETSNIPSFCR
nr:EOG090X07TK [Triops cancriformis]